MPQIQYQGQSYALNEGESVLDGLLRYGVDYPHSCRAGICQSCLMKSASPIDPAWQMGIQETLKSQAYFLACLAQPKEDLVVLPPLDTECTFEAELYGLAFLNHNVMQLKLKPANLDTWAPGQYLNLINPEGIIRSYSIANQPKQDGFIELHVKVQGNGCMSQWLKTSAKIGDQVKIRGPLGNCFYFNPKKLSYDILLVGTGTGLAPLVGIVKEALSQGHSGQITLLHGGVLKEDLYYQNELHALAGTFANFHYATAVLKNEKGELDSPIDQVVLQYIHTPKNLHVFVCGPEETTKKLKMKIFCAGVPSQQILSDAFV